MTTLAPKEWGTHLWKLLHTTAECLGVQTHPLLKRDEANHWSFLLNSVTDIMPCPQCQKHYREWLRKHPSAQFQNLEGTTLRDVARKWLWELHNEVNQRNGVAALPFDDVALLYKDTTPADFRQLLGLVTEKVGVKGEPLRKFRKCFLLLLKLINKV